MLATVSILNAFARLANEHLYSQTNDRLIIADGRLNNPSQDHLLDSMNNKLEMGE